MKKLIKGSELVDKTLEMQDDGSLRIVTSGKFKPKGGEMFWYITDCGIINKRIYCSNEGEYTWLLNHQLVFATKEECEEYKHYLELLDEYTYNFSDAEWKNEHLVKYYIVYHCDTVGLISDCSFCTKGYKNYFLSREKIIEFVNAVGEDNIKKFMFDIWG